jgi:biotin transport system substrate-specific component
MKNDAVLLGQRFFPESGILEDLLVAFGGSALIAVLAQISVGSGPSPITGFTLGVFLVALFFGAKRAVLALLLYVLEAAIGLPVLTGLLGGWHRLVLPNAGYFLGAFVATFTVGSLANRGWTRKPELIFAAVLIGTALIYIIALPWLAIAAPEIPFPQTDQTQVAFSNPIMNVLKAGFFPFLTGDLIKILICVVVFIGAWALDVRFTLDKNL